ncbi:MAG TPA: glucose-6-phosphate isomerase family protein [Candidatus Omnitrophota bacterium]|nr:glucose-6-phosphate isomerase family protein [Candidatus Omnitrophota bacterium]
MRDLSRASGLDLRLDSRKHALVFGKAVVHSLAKESGSLKCRLYGDARGIKDTDILYKNKLKFDLTLLSPGRIGKHLPMTLGVYPRDGRTKLYEVISGQAWFLLQKENKDDCRIIDDVILLKAREGEKIILPPGYGHVLINPGKDDLVAACFSSRALICESQKYLRAKGGVYFIFKDNLGEFFQPNPFYREVPYMRIACPSSQVERFGLNSAETLYNLASKGIEKLDFLNNPAKYDYSDVLEFL